MSIRKAVFPVAGLGTRFLPATKTVPKELLPVLNKPLIQYASEEALRAGVTELIFVVSRGKMAIRDYYDRAHELEALLADRNKSPLLDSIRSMKPEGVHCSFVLQPEPRGLGHAVLCAREAVGNEPFAVILPDDLIDDGQRGCLVQMTEDFARRGRSLVAVEIVPPADTDKYGIVTISDGNGAVARMTGIVEKPKPAEAPSNLGVVGRYLFTAGIFEHLERIGAGSGGEIQLTDAVARMLPEEEVFAFRFEGTRYDCGSKSGMLRATLAYALKDPALAPLIRGQSRNP
jgi:UTP--glucose-1-phosphate uridylyltransferase